MKSELLSTGILISVICGFGGGLMGGMMAVVTNYLMSGIIFSVVVGIVMLCAKGSPIYA